MSPLPPAHFRASKGKTKDFHYSQPPGTQSPQAPFWLFRFTTASLELSGLRSGGCIDLKPKGIPEAKRVSKATRAMKQ